MSRWVTLALRGSLVFLGVLLVPAVVVLGFLASEVTMQQEGGSLLLWVPLALAISLLVGSGFVLLHQIWGLLTHVVKDTIFSRECLPRVTVMHWCGIGAR